MEPADKSTSNAIIRTTVSKTRIPTPTTYSGGDIETTYAYLGIGLVLAAILLIVLIIGIISCVQRKRRRTKVGEGVVVSRRRRRARRINSDVVRRKEKKFSSLSVIDNTESDVDMYTSKSTILTNTDLISEIDDFNDVNQSSPLNVTTDAEVNTKTERLKVAEYVTQGETGINIPKAKTNLPKDGANKTLINAQHQNEEKKYFKNRINSNEMNSSSHGNTNLPAVVTDNNIRSNKQLLSHGIRHFAWMDAYHDRDGMESYV